MMDGVGRMVKERGGEIYPRRVRQMFMRRSAPQPAMRKTPRGGTGVVICQ